MGVKTVSPASSDRQKWDLIFNGLVKMLRSQQERLEILVKERKIIEDRLKTQHGRWASHLQLYEDHIFQLKADFKYQEMSRKVEAAKADMVLGLKQREALLCKLKLVDAEDVLGDFKAWFEFHAKNQEEISQRNIIGTNKGLATAKGSSSKSLSSRTLEGKVSRLEYETLDSESSQITALSAENKFVWNQFNLLEIELNNELNSKHAELEKARNDILVLISSMEELKSSNIEKDEMIERLKRKVSQKEVDVNQHEKINSKHAELEKAKKDIEVLISTMEELKSSNAEKHETIERLKDKLSQKEADSNACHEEITKMSTELEMLKSSNIDKDEMIKRLKVDLSHMEADANKCHEMISRMSKELEQLRKSTGVPITPVLRPSQTGGRNSVLRDRKGDCDPEVKKEFSSAQVSCPLKDGKKGSRSSKRKLNDAITSFETPKLFTSAFKVPKLKTLSAR